MESIVAGSYDRFLFGFQCSTSGRTEDYELKRNFTYPAHKGPVKCIAAAAPYIASGGADDLIHLYDLQTDVDLGFLMSPGEGAVSSLAFHSLERDRHPSHLFSGAVDGTLSVWQAGGEWVCLKSFHGHKKEISGITIHPSGRLALTVSRDCTLRLWNLVKGKCAHTSTLPDPADQIAFSASGDSHVTGQGSEAVYQKVGASPSSVMSHPRRVLCLAFPGENALLTGTEDGAVRLWDPRAAASSPVALIQHAHKTRTKAIAPSSSSIANQSAGIVASASSDGVVKLWDFRKIASSQGSTKPLATASTAARLTCLAALDPSSVSSAKAVAKETSANDHKSKERLKSMVRASQAALKTKAASVDRVTSSGGINGSAQNGVVDFPDQPDARQKIHKRKSARPSGPSKTVKLAARGTGP